MTALLRLLSLSFLVETVQTNGGCNISLEAELCPYQAYTRSTRSIPGLYQIYIDKKKKIKKRQLVW